FFQQCRNQSSEIVKGDPGNLDVRPPSASREQVVPAISAQGEPLLAWEKKRWIGRVIPTCHPEAGYRIRALTGSIIGGYFHHHQCGRWLCFHFLLPEAQPRCNPLPGDDELTARRRARGREFEDKVVSHLHSQNKILSIIAEKDENDRERTIEDRFVETIFQLQRVADEQNMVVGTYLYQPVLSVDNLFSLSSAFFNCRDSQKIILPGVGIPDLIQLAAGEEAEIVLQVGDIKSSRQPRYDQKWQVAFYAFLLNIVLHNEPQLSRLKVADSGFLLTPSPLNDLPRRHTFALQPYFASIKVVFAHLQASLCTAPMQAGWQLQKHCPGCPYFEFCYEQALREEEVQFIPRLTRGLLQKMRSDGIKSLHQEVQLDESFGPGQRDYLKGIRDALGQHKIAIVKPKTARFPANISTGFFVQLVHDPLTALPRGVGLGVLERGKVLEIMTWTADGDGCEGEHGSEEECRHIWREFSSCLLGLWQDAVQDGRGPHLFLFGTETREGISAWAAMMADTQVSALFRPGIDACCTDLQEVLSDHFLFPLPGVMSLFALNRILGLMDETAIGVPESLFHGERLPAAVISGDENDAGGDRNRVKDFLSTSCRLIMKLEQWIEEHLESEWQREDWRIIHPDDLDRGAACCRFIEAEKNQRERDIRSLQELSLAERVERFRALGPLRFMGTTLDEEGRFLYLFSLVDRQAGVAKFRSGDFLRLVPCGAHDVQSGMPVVMDRYNIEAGQVALSFRLGRDRGAVKSFSSSLVYSLEEDGEDYHSATLLDAVRKGFSIGDHQPIVDLFAGEFDYEQPPDWQKWLSGWLSSEGQRAGLNHSQLEALALPFHSALSLISGPPGTGKTHLLGWILIALIRHAQASGSRLRIAVSAVTHQAIDQVLNKVVALVNACEIADFPARCVKWGRWEGEMFAPEERKMQVEAISNARDAGEVLLSSHLIVGATGYGLQKMMRNFDRGTDGCSRFFDWVIFDEASQMLIPQAVLSLIHGKANFLFLGDVCQLPPVIRSSIFKEEMTAAEGENVSTVAAESRCSLLDILLRRYPGRSRQLEVTYRMNAEICRFPSRTWYGDRLHPAPENARARLSLTGVLGNELLDTIIDPQKPVALVGVKHHGCEQESAVEADVLSRLAGRLMRDYGICQGQLAIISPHRAQNNLISRALSALLGDSGELPVIDTVERLQGAERDVILFGFTCSDSDLVLAEFLNNPHRFNVAITRARRKLIVVGSKIFFEAVANSEKQLRANACFKDFFQSCQELNCYFDLEI
ncbi:MAG: AAA family ATPase, partial [Xanthomonadaceae bacterium]|nr:AAA family ATPase [Xanthomonadaceae bacterium]